MTGPQRRGRITWLTGTAISLVGLITFVVAPSAGTVLIASGFPAAPRALLWGATRTIGAAVVVVGLITCAAGIGYTRGARWAGQDRQPAAD